MRRSEQSNGPTEPTFTNDIGLQTHCRPKPLVFHYPGLHTAFVLSKTRRILRHPVILISALALTSATVLGLGSLLAQGGASAASATGTITSWGPEAHHVEGLFNGNAVTALEEMANLTLSDNSSMRAYCIDIGTGTNTGNAYDEASWQSAHPQSDIGKIQWVLAHELRPPES